MLGKGNIDGKIHKKSLSANILDKLFKKVEACENNSETLPMPKRRRLVSDTQGGPFVYV